ncbi:MAG: hypothetical protein WCJ57_03400 [Candidatus Falkowbacteria bacterium]
METKEKIKSQTEIYDERRKFMFIGITVIMAVIAILWVFNISSFINPYSEKLISTNQEKLDWKDVKGRFDKTMSQVVSQMDQFEAKKELAANPANASSSLDNLEAVLSAKISESHSSSSAVSTSSTSTGSIAPSGDLKARLEDMEKSLNKK